MLTNACHTLHRFTAGLSATSSRRCSRTGITQLVVELRAASIVITLHASRHRKSQDRHTRRSVNGTNAFCLAVAHGQPARGSAHVGFWRLLTDHCAARGVAVPIKFRCETRARRSLVTAHTGNAPHSGPECSGVCHGCLPWRESWRQNVRYFSPRAQYCTGLLFRTT